MTKQRFMVIMIFVNAALMMFNTFYTHDTTAVLINLFGCITSWVALYMLDWTENKRSELKNKLGEEHDDE